MADWRIRQLTEEVSKWTSRAAQAERTGQIDLLKRALKHKSRLEKQLVEYQKILDEAKSRRGQQVTYAALAADHGCLWCYFAKQIETSMGISIAEHPFQSTDVNAMVESMKASGMIKSDFDEYSEDSEDNDAIKKSACEHCLRNMEAREIAISQLDD